MKPARWTTLLLLLLVGGAAVVITHHLLRPRPLVLPASAMQFEPLTMIWAWETPEDLTALDPSRTGVAFLNRELTLHNNEVSATPRHQPLSIAPNTWLMADVRIDAPHAIENTPQLRSEVIGQILPATRQPQVRALQIDFDAAASQVPFYAALLRELKPQMPPGMPLSVTALTSWCGPKSWLPALAPNIDEAVPMFFRMGETAADRTSRRKDTSVITQPLCASSAGVATDETWPARTLDNASPHTAERVYIFRKGPWTRDDLERLNTRGPASLHPASRPSEQYP